MNINYYLLLKAEGKSVKEHPVMQSLLRIRTLLEKLRPLDKKLKYQIDKLVRLANLEETQQHMDGTNEEKPTLMLPAARTSQDPLKFKPNPQNMVLNKRMEGKVKAYLILELSSIFFFFFDFSNFCRILK
jgi:hypothetical protein